MVQTQTARANTLPDDLKTAGWRLMRKPEGVFLKNDASKQRTHVVDDLPLAVAEARDLMNGTATDEPGEMPKDLAAAGWKLKEHVGPNKDKFQCANRRLHLGTSEYVRAQDAIGAARKLQEKHKGKGGNGAAGEQEPTEAEAAREMGEIKRLYAHKSKPDGTYSVLRRFPEPHHLKLSPAQIEEKCDALDSAMSRKEKIEADFKAVKETFKADIEVAEQEVAAIEKSLRRREEEREVDVEERLYRAEATVRVVNPATGEVFRERPADLLEMSEHPTEI